MNKMLNNPLVNKHIFFPRRTNVEPTNLIDVGGIKLACYYKNPYTNSGTILHFHGNGELAADYWEELSSLFTDSGLNVCFVDYRGYGLSEGEPELITQLGDGAAIVKSLGVPLDKLIVLGRSLGSVFAIDLVDRLPGIAGLVLESAIADVLEDWRLEQVTEEIGADLKGLRKEVNEHLDLHEKMSGYRGHLLILHTEHDDCVNISNAERLYAWGSTKNKRMVVFPVGDHNTIMHFNTSEYTKELYELAKRIGVVDA